MSTNSLPMPDFLAKRLAVLQNASTYHTLLLDIFRQSIADALPGAYFQGRSYEADRIVGELFCPLDGRTYKIEIHAQPDLSKDAGADTRLKQQGAPHGT